MGLADRRYDSPRGGFRGGRGGWGTGSWGGGGGGISFGYALTPWVKRLLILNFAVYLVSNLLGLLPFDWVVRSLGFSAATVLAHPWTPITYMFVHGGFGHIFFNMLVLFFFGPPLEREWGGREFLKFYLICGVGAALTSVLLVRWIGTPPVIGASGALLGVMLAFAMRWPDSPVLIWFVFPVKVKYLVGFMIVMDLWATRSALSTAGSGVATWAHLGGAATAWTYLRFGDRIGRRLSAIGRRRRKLGLDTRTRRGSSGGSGRTPGRKRSVDGDSLDEVDRILDKIRDGGIESLTAREKEFLDEMSRRYRGGNE